MPLDRAQRSTDAEEPASRMSLRGKGMKRIARARLLAIV
jgi:hypothetical protein